MDVSSGFRESYQTFDNAVVFQTQPQTMNITVPDDSCSTLLNEDEYTLKSTNEVQHFDPSQIPFYDLGSNELIAEVWEEGVNRYFKPLSYRPKKRGNYVRNYVLSNLRTQAKLTRLKVGWNLEALWDVLPVELIISIFEFLHPIDLYHAIRATKGLRRFLLAKTSSTIWKESFLNHPDIPFYPPDISAPNWVSLIFGPATCDVCNADNTLVDYAFRLRVCDDCAAHDIQDEWGASEGVDEIIRVFPDHADNINIRSLAVQSYRYNSFYYATEEHLQEPRYSLKEVDGKIDRLQAYLLDIRSGVPNAHAEQQAFLSVTRAATQESMKHIKLCEMWAREIHTRSEGAFAASVFAFCDKSKMVLLKQGHDERDVNSAQDVFKMTMASRATWADQSDPVLRISKLRKYLPQLQSMVEERRVTRLRTELTQRITKRRGALVSCYFKTVRTCLTAKKACYMPHPEKLYQQKFFADFINDPKESVGELDTLSAQHHILLFTDTHISTRKRLLLKILLNTGLLPQDATEESNPDDFLGLAFAVFECCQNSVLVGWEDVGIHHPTLKNSCQEEIMNQGDYVFPATLFKFSDVGYQVLRNLAELLHLDLRLLLAKDLDTLNKRFICKMCKFDRQGGLHGLYSMTWRECLTHAKQMRSVPSEGLHCTMFDVLSETIAISVIAMEQPFPPPGESNWTCKRCDFYFQPIKRAEVIAHIRTVHSIAKPVDGVDFIYCLTEGGTNRSPLYIGLDEYSNHRCMRCPSPKSLRLWKTPDMFRHILDKHAIQSNDLVEGVDWIKVKAVDDDTWIKEKMHAEGIVST